MYIHMHKDWFSLFLVSHLLYVIPIFLTSVQHYCSFVVVFFCFLFTMNSPLLIPHLHALIYFLLTRLTSIKSLQSINPLHSNNFAHCSLHHVCIMVCHNSFTVFYILTMESVRLQWEPYFISTLFLKIWRCPASYRDQSDQLLTV